MPATASRFNTSKWQTAAATLQRTQVVCAAKPTANADLVGGSRWWTLSGIHPLLGNIELLARCEETVHRPGLTLIVADAARSVLP